jgi:Leucine-rich repeat (LRR) protein
MTARPIPLLMVVTLALIACGGQPASPTPTDAPTLAPTPTATVTPPPTFTPTATQVLTPLQEQQLAVMKAIFPDYDGPQDVCEWDQIEIECDRQGHIISLNINNTGLKALPSEIGQLSSLERLWMYSNKLTTLPPEISYLTSLKSLHIGFNPLTRLPLEFGQLASVEALYISPDQMGLLEQISHLPNLRFLSLFTGQPIIEPIVILPQIGLFTQLKALDLSYLELTSLPPEIGSLLSLRVLYLRGNKLSTLPPTIGDLSNLEVLDISINPLTSLPPEIEHLPNLETLDLTGALLTALPPAICDKLRHAISPPELCP